MVPSAGVVFELCYCLEFGTTCCTHYQLVVIDKELCENECQWCSHMRWGWGNWWGNVTLLLEVCAGTLNSDKKCFVTSKLYKVTIPSLRWGDCIEGHPKG